MQDDSVQQSPPENPGWLATLQQESWQAEILISGGGIVGVLALFEQTGDVQEALWHGTALDPDVAIFTTMPFLLITFILAQAFLLHLVLRGYWVGLVGLNVVFPRGINQEKLAFQGKFKSFIKGNSNTPYLIKLDGLCSLIFAFTFFFIFSVAGLLLFALFVTGVVMSVQELPDWKILRRVTGYSLLLVGLFTLADFFTFGYLKRVRWISRFYFPVHYVISRVTLSFLYRRLYYSIISNIRPVYIILGLSAELLILALLITFSHSLPDDIKPIRSGEDDFMELQEGLVTGNSISFSFPHFPWLEGELFAEWVKSHEDTTMKSFEDLPKEDKLELIGNAYIITIDSVQADSLSWMMTPHDVLGFGTTRLTYLADVRQLSRGRHELALRLRIKQSKYTGQDSLKYFARAYFLVDK